MGNRVFKRRVFSRMLTLMSSHQFGREDVSDLLVSASVDTIYGIHVFKGEFNQYVPASCFVTFEG
ncbi:MAG: hypothetical protein CMK32_07910 [Porticoccaceae bacterium]|nr:hypothetical protein [Porticoccaceae bacterium]